MINFKDKMQHLFIMSGLETQKEFIEKVLNNAISTQAFSEYLKSEKNANFQTLQVLIAEIKKYPKFKDLSPAFFFSESNNISSKNINIAKETGLSDETIKNIKLINQKNNNSINNFINNINVDFWNNVEMLEKIKKYKEICSKLKNIDILDLKNHIELLEEKLNLQDIIFPTSRPTVYDFEEKKEIYYPTIESENFKNAITILKYSKDNKKNIEVKLNPFTYIYDTSKIEKQFKFETNEYLTLYLNK